jgi:hypothetical protein
MPILIRIILQRLLVSVFGILAFFGINPDISVPSQIAIEEQKENQQERVEQILQVKEDPGTTTPSEDVVKEVESKIAEIQKEFTQTVTRPVTDTAKDIIPTNLVFSDESTGSFDVKNVVVNIMCLEKTNSYTRLSTGSGVVITSTGLILTNAHVAYPFLKSSQFDSSTYSCSVRRENIPNYGYNAELVYYPLDWLRENKEIIKDPSPIGTGENDYALLQITGGIGPTPKTTGFMHALTQTSLSDLKTDTLIVVAGYPSSNSGVFEIDAKPGLKVAQSRIVDFFTFGSRSYDVLQTGPNTVARRGSSGGGIFNDRNLYGIVVTTNSNSGGSYINALTLPYIKRDFESDTGVSFDSFISRPKEALLSEFSSNKEKIKEIISEN